MRYVIAALLLTTRCGAYHHNLASTPTRGAVPISTRAPTPLVLAADAAGHAHDHQHHGGGSATTQLKRKLSVALVAAALRVRQLFAAIARWLLQWLPSASLAASASASFEAVPRGAVAIDGARSAANLLVVQGAATRSVPPPNEMLVFFGYGLSPFYAELGASETAKAGGESRKKSGGGAGSSVRWLRHKFTRVPNEYQLAADEGRLDLLRELYTEASVQERKRRNAARWPWLSSDGGTVARTPEKGEDAEEEGGETEEQPEWGEGGDPFAVAKDEEEER